MKKKSILYLSLPIILIVIIVLYFFSPYRILSKFSSSKIVQWVVDEHQDDVFSRLGPNFIPFANNIDKTEISILAFKEEKLLELYARNLDSTDWTLIKTYPFTSFSGKLGPKLKEGDKQIPEGIYKVESLNPNSSYHLSLRVNYPNDFDKKMAEKDGRKNLGGDIMIHGKNVTIGCIPIGDQAIEEVFILSAKTIQHSIPILISPKDFRATENNLIIEGIDWEGNLYQLLEEDLKNYGPMPFMVGIP